jgi:hypothetical protein
MAYAPGYFCREHPTAGECVDREFRNERTRMAPNEDWAFPAGQRVARRTGESTVGRTDIKETGPPICLDGNGSLLWMGSAMIGDAVIPCKVYHSYSVFIPDGGREQMHDGHYDALVYDLDVMELVVASRGEIPTDKRPVQGGFDLEGRALYHAVGTVQLGAGTETRIPGRTGVHM